MPRNRSEHVAEVKAKLVARLRDGFFRPGDRFMSNRSIAARYHISYQTAHRLVNELTREGLLIRRSASGTYVPGRRAPLAGVQLLFHERAQRQGSFGARLLELICGRLERLRIHSKVVACRDDRPVVPSESLFPVIWEAPALLNACRGEHRRALLLNDRPPQGLDSVFIDSVSADDFSGGVCAAQLLRRAGRGPFAIVAGPRDDRRSDARVQGFLSCARAAVIVAGGWYLEDGQGVAARAVESGRGGIFCCNDRLAESIVSHCRDTRRPVPPLVGFDDAPIAERLNLTTIAIPWEELADAAIAVIQRRLAHDPATASHQMLSPRPVVREQP